MTTIQLNSDEVRLAALGLLSQYRDYREDWEEWRRDGNAEMEAIRLGHMNAVAELLVKIGYWTSVPSDPNRVTV